MLEHVEAGDWDVPQYEDDGPSPNVLRVIEQMEGALDADDAYGDDTPQGVEGTDTAPRP